jgi:hypothetical protein
MEIYKVSKILPSIFLSVILFTGMSGGSETVTVAATCDSSGHITVSCVLPGSLQIFEATLYRTYLDFDQLKNIDIYANPISSLPLSPAQASRTIVDSFCANGVAYYYYILAKSRNGETCPCNVAHVTVPFRVIRPETITDCNLLIDKNNYTLELRAGSTLLKTYAVCLGGNPVTRKLHQDNLTTPEGVYKIDYIQLQSQFYKALGVSYPNATDRARYAEACKRERLTASIGGSIQIHGGGIGNNWTWGCIALRNEDIDELLAIPSVKPGMKVVIVGREVTRKSP